MKNIYLIVGPSGSGKSSVAHELSRLYGMKEVCSYTERPPRYEGETGHIFVTPEQFDAAGKMCAFTIYNGYRYGVPESAIEENDLYVIDPAGIKYMRKEYDGAKGIVVIAVFVSEDERIRRMLERGDDACKIKGRILFDREAFKDLMQITDHVFVNADLDATVFAIHEYIERKEKSK